MEARLPSFFKVKTSKVRLRETVGRCNPAFITKIDHEKAARDLQSGKELGRTGNYRA